MVGDINAKEVETMIKNQFSDWQFQGEGTPKPRIKYTIPENKEPIISIASDPELPYSLALVVMKNSERDAMTYGTYREILKEQLFSVMFNMRFSEIAQEPNPPFLQAGGQIGEFLAGVQGLQLIVVPKQDMFDEGFERLMNETFRIDQHGFTPSELARAKETLIAAIERMYNERDKTENRALAKEIAGYFEETESFAGIEKD